MLAVASTSRLTLRPLARRAPAPLLPPRSTQPSRSFASSHACRLAASPASRSGDSTPSTSKAGAGAVRKSKIQTIPFMCTADVARASLTMAAHSAFGFTSIMKLLFSRFFGGIEAELKMVAFRPVLVPVWRVDLFLNGVAELEEVDVNLCLSTTDATLPGFGLSPLNNLPITSRWESEPVTYEPSKHLNQVDAQGEDLKITALPFTLSPLNFLPWLSKLPRTDRSKFGLNLLPSAIRSSIFAAYPLYIPIYMAEFTDVASEKKNVTCVAFATSSVPTFAMYPSFIQEPAWMPFGSGIELALSGSPVDPTARPTPGALARLVPQLDLLTSDVPGSKLLQAIESVEEIEGHPRAMAYSDHAADNQNYVKSLTALEVAEVMFKRMEGVDDDTKTVLLSMKGIQTGKGSDLKEDVKKSKAKAVSAAESSKPEWLKALEEASKSRRS